MRHNTRHLLTLLFLAFSVPFLMSCDSNDDIKEIFTGKVWKLSYIFAEGAYSTPIDFWNGNSNTHENSIKLRDTAGNFIIEFNGAEMDGLFKGAVNGRVANQTFTGQWQADASTHTFAISSLKFSGSEETDVWAINFKKGLSNAYKYTGDANGLYLHYKDNTVERVLALFVSKTK